MTSKAYPLQPSPQRGPFGQTAYNAPLNWPTPSRGGSYGGSPLPDYSQAAYNGYAGINAGLDRMQYGLANQYQNAVSTRAAQDAYAQARAANEQRYNQVLGNPQAYASSYTVPGTQAGWTPSGGGYVYNSQGTPSQTYQIQLTPERQRYNEFVGNANGGLKDRYIRSSQAYDNLGSYYDNSVNQLRGDYQNSANNLQGYFNRGADEVRGQLAGSDQTQGYWDRYYRGLDNLEGMGNQAKKDAAKRANTENSIRQQNLERRGLGNSTIIDSSRRATARDLNDQLGRIDESVRSQRLTTDASLSGDALDYANRFGLQSAGINQSLLGQGVNLGQNLMGTGLSLGQNLMQGRVGLGERAINSDQQTSADILNFITNRNDVYPDLSNFYNIQQGYGRYA